jgi:hypothetical protein
MTALELNAMTEALIWLGLDPETIAILVLAALSGAAA